MQLRPEGADPGSLVPWTAATSGHWVAGRQPTPGKPPVRSGVHRWPALRGAATGTGDNHGQQRRGHTALAVKLHPRRTWQGGLAVPCLREAL